MTDTDARLRELALAATRAVNEGFAWADSSGAILPLKYAIAVVALLDAKAAAEKRATMLQKDHETALEDRDYWKIKAKAAERDLVRAREALREAIAAAENIRPQVLERWRAALGEAGNG